MSTPYPTVLYPSFPDQEPFPTVSLPINTATNATTITVNQLLAGTVTHVITSDRSLTLPSAATLIADMKIHGVTVVGSALDFTLLTTPSYTTTIIPGTGGSILGGADITESGMFRIIVTDLTVGSENYIVIHMSGGKPEFDNNPLPFTTALNSTALSATNNLRSVIVHNITTDLTLMLDTAANLLTAFGPTTQVGSYYDFTVQTTPGFISTLLVGTGGTLLGVNTTDGAGRYRIQFTNVSGGTEAYLLIRLASDAGNDPTVPAPVYVTAANPGTLSAADVLKKNVFYTATSSQSVTFPTAALLVAALGGTAVAVGTAVELTLVTTRGYVLTCVAGTNGTLIGGGRLEYSGSFRFIITNSGAGTETYQVVRQDSAEPALRFATTPITTAPINKTPLASSDLLSEVFTYDCNINSTAQMPAASTLLTALAAFKGHPIAVGFAFDFTAIVVSGFLLTIGTIDPSITLIGSNQVSESATFRVIFTNVSGGTEAYRLVRLDSTKSPTTTPTVFTAKGDANFVLTASELLTGVIVQSTNTADRTLTLDSAVNLVGGMYSAVGHFIDFSVIATEQYRSIIAMGAGGTLYGTGRVLSSGRFRLIFTNVSGGTEAYVVVRMDCDGTDFFPRSSSIVVAIGDADTVLTASQIHAGRFIQQASLTADRMLTLPTAAQIKTQMGGVVDGTNFEFTVITDQPNRSIVVAGAGGTLYGSGVVTNTGTFLIALTTGGTAYNVFRLDSDTNDFGRVVATVLTTAASSLTGAQLAGNRTIVHSPLSPDTNNKIDFPSTASIAAALQTTVTGASFEVTILTSPSATTQIVPHVEGTLYGSPTVRYSATFRIILTGASSYNILRLDSVSQTTQTPTATASPAFVATVNQVISGVINHTSSVAGATETVTFPSAASMITGALSVPDPKVGTTYDVVVLALQGTVQVLPGAGGTLVSGHNDIVQNTAAGTFRIRFTNIGSGTEAYDVLRIGCGKAPLVTKVAPPAAKDITGGITLTVNEIYSGIIRISTGAPQTITLPSAVGIYGTASLFATPGSIIDFSVINATGSGGIATITSGAGGTNDSSSVFTVATGSSRMFRVRITSSTTYDLFTMS